MLRAAYQPLLWCLPTFLRDASCRVRVVGVLVEICLIGGFLTQMCCLILLVILALVMVTFRDALSGFKYDTVVKTSSGETDGDALHESPMSSVGSIAPDLVHDMPLTLDQAVGASVDVRDVHLCSSLWLPSSLSFQIRLVHRHS
jgi:hypothetical protein